MPIVHQAWQPLKLLFHSENIFIVAKAFKVLHIFAKCAKDFIHRRTLTDIFPPIINYLKKLDLMAKDREMHQTMIARQSRSLLQEITEGLWEFMAQLDLTELDIDPVVEQMINFVNCSNQLSFKEKNNYDRIEKVVHDSAAETLKYYTPDRAIDDDTLWLKLYFEKK